MIDIVYILFLFALGACVGSFLNVVVWRLPRGESLVSPPSHCPKCNTALKWNDNIPVFGWLFLRGRCRYCKEPISARYPLIEALCGLLFVFYYFAFFMEGVWTVPVFSSIVYSHDMPTFFTNASLGDQWPMYALYMFMISSLLAASLIDAELLIIPLEIPWIMAAVAIPFHAVVDRAGMPGSLSSISITTAALAAGAGIGFCISLLLWLLGWMPMSFPDGEPLLEVDRAALIAEIAEHKRQGKAAELMPPVPPPYTKHQIRIEIGKELIFLMPALLLGMLAMWLTMPGAPFEHAWQSAMHHTWLRGLLGSVFGALIGAFVVWIVRILGTLGFGRVAMGLGDVHLMFGVGAVIGAGAVTVAFFLAPFFGISIALYMFITGKRRELPYGPYLSLGTAAVLIFYNDIAARFGPGFAILGSMIKSWLMHAAGH